jgi:microcystin-dependent protein
MAITNTTYLGLNKPDYDAIADIEVLNDNSDIIDEMFDGTHLVESVNGVTPTDGAVEIDLGVTSVNGQTGAVTITERSVKQLIDIIYPVGTYYETTDATFNPNTAWAGTTWQKITDGRVLIAGGDEYTVGTNYGEKTHKITTSEMPTHNHTASTADNGNHTHTRGSMNITGWHDSEDSEGVAGGAFTISYRASTYNNRTQGGQQNTVVNFDASRAWTGETSVSGLHNHEVTVGNSGSGTAMNMLQPSKAVARWLRTA